MTPSSAFAALTRLAIAGRSFAEGDFLETRGTGRGGFSPLLLPRGRPLVDAAAHLQLP
jgi:hypothetical protein